MKQEWALRTQVAVNHAHQNTGEQNCTPHHSGHCGRGLRTRAATAPHRPRCRTSPALRALHSCGISMRGERGGTWQHAQRTDTCTCAETPPAMPGRRFSFRVTRACAHACAHEYAHACAHEYARHTLHDRVSRCRPVPFRAPVPGAVATTTAMENHGKSWKTTR